MGRTGIEWATDTLNPVRGCADASAGCLNCYAKRLAATRLVKHPKYAGLATFRGVPRWTGEVQLDIDVMREVVGWRLPRQCFLCDMSDLFYERVDDDFILAVLGFVAMAWRHRFYILTKRSARMQRVLAALDEEAEPGHKIADALIAVACIDEDYACSVANVINGYSRWRAMPDDGNPLNGTVPRWPLPNLWLGVSAENQRAADERIPHLLNTPAAVRFVSYEPAIGPLSIRGLAMGNIGDVARCACGHGHGFTRCPNYGGVSQSCSKCDCVGFRRAPCSGGIHWVIAGAESGPGARYADVSWARSVRDQCAEVGAAFFLKQWVFDGSLLSLPRLDGVVHNAYPEARP